MRPGDRLRALHERIRKQEIDGLAAIGELRSILTSLADPYAREKTVEALEQARIYFQSHGSMSRQMRKLTRDSLLQDIYKASVRCRE
jgi:hypothetical protein